MTRFALSEWFMAEWSVRSVIRPHGEEARAFRDAPAMLLMLRARAVSNHEGGPCHPATRRPHTGDVNASRWRNLGILVVRTKGTRDGQRFGRESRLGDDGPHSGRDRARRVH